MWLPGAGFNFRTDYAPTDADESEARQYSLHVDLKASSVVVTELDPHLYRLPERQIQNSFVTVLPRWDQDVPAASALPFLLILGDMSSTELNMFGRSNTDWIPYNGDEISLPMGYSDTELTLLGLDVDLRSTKGKPILYAYLNDGTLIAWYLESEKKYAGMITSSYNHTSSSAPTASTPTSVPTQTTPLGFSVPSPPSDKPAAQAPAFGSNPPAFGSTTVSSNSPAQTSAFGSTPSAFGSGTFGSSSSTFGNTGGVFGSAKPGGFGSGFGSSNTSAFGQPSGFGAQQPAFGSAQPAFGSAQPTFGTGFGGGGGFGSNPSQPATAFGSSSQATPSSFGTGAFGGGQAAGPVKKDEAMSGGGFGGLSLGGSNNATDADKKPAGGIFGSAAPAASTTSAFGSSSGGFGSSVLKPAEGFGATSVLPSDSPFAKAGATSNGGSAFASAFGGGPAKPTVASGFGQPSFGQTSKPAFSAGGGSGFGQPVGPPKAGGFGAFAGGGTSGFGSAAPATKAGGFAAFATNSKPAENGLWFWLLLHVFMLIHS